MRRWLKTTIPSKCETWLEIAFDEKDDYFKFYSYLFLERLSLSGRDKEVCRLIVSFDSWSVNLIYLSVLIDEDNNNLLDPVGKISDLLLILLEPKLSEEVSSFVDSNSDEYHPPENEPQMTEPDATPSTNSKYLFRDASFILVSKAIVMRNQHTFLLLYLYYTNRSAKDEYLPSQVPGQKEGVKIWFWK